MLVSYTEYKMKKKNCVWFVESSTDEKNWFPDLELVENSRNEARKTCKGYWGMELRGRKNGLKDDVFYRVKKYIAEDCVVKQPKELTLIAGSTGLGKSTLCGNISWLTPRNKQAIDRRKFITI